MQEALSQITQLKKSLESVTGERNLLQIVRDELRQDVADLKRQSKEQTRVWNEELESRDREILALKRQSKEQTRVWHEELETRDREILALQR